MYYHSWKKHWYFAATLPWATSKDRKHLEGWNICPCFCTKISFYFQISPKPLIKSLVIIIIIIIIIITIIVSLFDFKYVFQRTLTN